MTSKTDKEMLRATIDQERKSYRHFLTKAEAAHSTGDFIMEREYRICAEMARHQSEMAQTMLDELTAIECQEIERLAHEAQFKKQSGDGVYAR